MADLMPVTDDNFEAEVLKSELPVLVDFTATWCGPCKQLAPIVEELAKENAGKIKVMTCDVDRAQQTSVQYGIMSVPTLLFISGGEVREQLMGVQSKTTLQQKIDAIAG